LEDAADIANGITVAGHEILKHVADTWANLQTIPFLAGSPSLT
jgi:hypothetical protein